MHPSVCNKSVKITCTWLCSLFYCSTHEMVGFTNRMAIPEGNEDNISQRMGSTVHDDDFQEAINMISDDVEQRQGFEAKVDLDAGRR